MSGSELSPCPFCGGPASVTFVSGLAFDWWAGCDACGIYKRVGAQHSREDDPKRAAAIEGWNQRRRRLDK